MAFGFLKRKKTEEKEHSLPKNYVIVKPIPQSENRGVYEKSMEVSIDGKVKEFPIADNTFIQVLREFGFPSLDITFGKRARRVKFDMGGIHG